MSNDDYITAILLDLDTIYDKMENIKHELEVIEDIRRRIKEYVKQIE